MGRTRVPARWGGGRRTGARRQTSTYRETPEAPYHRYAPPGEVLATAGFGDDLRPRTPRRTPTFAGRWGWSRTPRTDTGDTGPWPPRSARTAADPPSGAP